MSDLLDNIKNKFVEELNSIDFIIDSSLIVHNRLILLEKKYLGKNSYLKQEFENLKNLSKDQRKIIAKQLNEIKNYIIHLIDEKKQIISNIKYDDMQLQSEWMDLSLPSNVVQPGALQKISNIETKCMNILGKLGFKFIDGNEVVSAFYNFDALNIPENHSARDMHDTFWLPNNLVLRSHTTTIQAQYLDSLKYVDLKSDNVLPIKFASFGKVYRNEATDSTHLAVFHQLEGFWIEENLSFADLSGLILYLAKNLYDIDSKFRIKPKYYPYTEPSIGMDIQCVCCNGAGCDMCRDVGWITIIGAGMINREVFKKTELFKSTSKKIANKCNGIAFGWGTTRMAAQKYGIKKIKEFYEFEI